MNERSLRVAVQIIGQSSREHPADALLRDHFRKQDEWSRETSREVSQLVFAYFRWLGWLDPSAPLFQKVQSTWELQEKFNDRPESFSDAELAATVVPDWAREQVEVSPAWARSLQSEPTLWLRARRD